MSINEGLPVEFLIWGDSYARRSLSAFEKFDHLSGRAVLKNFTAPLLEYATASRGAREETLQWSEATFDYIERNHIKNVKLSRAKKVEAQLAERHGEDRGCPTDHRIAAPAVLDESLLEAGDLLGPLVETGDRGSLVVE